MSVAAHRGAGPRPGHHHRRLRAVGLRGHARDRDRHPDDPRASRSTTPSSSSTRSARTPGTSARTHQTYAEAANLAVNQTLVRSINTSIVALLPVGALLYVGVVTLGSGALKDLALVALRRHGGRRLLLDLHRHPAAGAAQGARARRQGGRPAGAAATAAVGRSTASPRCRCSARTCRSSTTPTTPTLGRRRAVGPRPARPGRATSGGNRPVPPGAPSRVTAGERPGTARPVSDSTAAGRPQPTRKPRSRRGKQ